MTNEELRKLSRKDLLRLLVKQGKECDSLRARLEEAEAALQDRKIKIEESGSLAEAVLRLNGIFEAAQTAADQYLENIKMRAESRSSSENKLPGVSEAAGVQGSGSPVGSGNKEEFY